MFSGNISRAKFPRLTALLQALPEETVEIRFTLAELSELAAGPLPPASWASFYWRNSGVSRQNWERYGFKAKLERPGRTVCFTRQHSAERRELELATR